jgi:hypothetical protein
MKECAAAAVMQPPKNELDLDISTQEHKELYAQIPLQEHLWNLTLRTQTYLTLEALTCHTQRIASPQVQIPQHKRNRMSHGHQRTVFYPSNSTQH